jgi:transcriptional regulator with XRE-family HTH domain
VCHIETLGERIRKLRKQQKFTLEALAGDQLTKGMLSLIENNKANPSMESLTYIAKRLGVEVSVLLEEVSSQELREVLVQAEKLYYTEIDDLTDEHEQLITLIEPYAPKLTQGYEAARLLELYSLTLHYEKMDDWKVYLDRAALLYEQMNIIPRRASIGIFRAAVKFTERDYSRALEKLLIERSEIETQNTFIDPMTRLDFDYTEAMLHFAVGNSKDALKVMESGIKFSREKQVFYRIDHLYRLATSHAMMMRDEEKIKYYVKKITLYGEFADDTEAILFTKFIEIEYLNSFKKDHKKALDLLEHYHVKYQLGEAHNSFFHLEKGKALFGLNNFELAIVELKKMKIAEYLHHPFDLAILYEADAYIALSYQALGNQEKALKHAKIAYENISPMPHSPYKDFINETYEKIRSRH